MESCLTCSWLDDDSGPQCGGPAEVYKNLPLCEEHKLSLQKMLDKTKRSLALQAAPHHDLDDFPGLCYIVLLPDGFVKIGYSNTEKLLEKRFKSLTSDYGAPVVPLAVLKGGFVREAVLHELFDEHRVPGLGERFVYCAEIAHFLGKGG